MIRSTEIRKGLALRIEGCSGLVVEAQHRTPGNKRGFMQVKLKSFDNGAFYTYKIPSGDNVEKIDVETRAAQYLYRDGNAHVFMDNENYEQYPLNEESIEGVLPYLVPNSPANLVVLDGKPVGVELPSSVVLSVTHTEDVARGDTANNLTKEAKLETGITIKVPAYIKSGEKVKVNTETGEFLERAKS